MASAWVSLKQTESLIKVNMRQTRLSRSIYMHFGSASTGSMKVHCITLLAPKWLVYSLARSLWFTLFSCALQFHSFVSYSVCFVWCVCVTLSATCVSLLVCRFVCVAHVRPTVAYMLNNPESFDRPLSKSCGYDGPRGHSAKSTGSWFKPKTAYQN